MDWIAVISMSCIPASIMKTWLSLSHFISHYGQIWESISSSYILHYNHSMLFFFNFHSPEICRSDWRAFVLFATVRFHEYLNICSKDTLFGSRQEGQRTYKVVYTWSEKQLMMMHFFLFCFVFVFMRASLCLYVVLLYLQLHQLWVDMHRGSTVCWPQVVVPVGSAKRSTECITLHISQLCSVAESCCPLIRNFPMLSVKLKPSEGFIFFLPASPLANHPSFLCNLCNAIYQRFSSMQAAVAVPTEGCLWRWSPWSPWMGRYKQSTADKSPFAGDSSRGWEPLRHSGSGSLSVGWPSLPTGWAHHFPERCRSCWETPRRPGAGRGPLNAAWLQRDGVKSTCSGLRFSRIGIKLMYFPIRRTYWSTCARLLGWGHVTSQSTNFAD